VPTSARPTRRREPQLTGVELVVCAVTLAALIALVVVFLVVFHDFPLRVA
jgi:hypothetical protein